MTWSETAPAPEQGLDAVWLFDGVCNFCSGSVALILRLDRDGVIRFSPIQSAVGRTLAITAGVDPDEPQTFVFFDRGAALQKSAAVIAILRRLGTPWRWLAAPAAAIPRSWRDAAYDYIAANRYRLMGRKDACMIPTPAVRARFLIDP